MALPSSRAPARRCCARRCNAVHRRLGARMVDFAGWDMPVQYPTGILAEHQAVRSGVRPVRPVAHGPRLPARQRRAGAGPGVLHARPGAHSRRRGGLLGGVPTRRRHPRRRHRLRPRRSTRCCSCSTPRTARPTSRWFAAAARPAAPRRRPGRSDARDGADRRPGPARPGRPAGAVQRRPRAAAGLCLRAGHGRRRSRRSCRAPATPARTASRSWSTPTRPSASGTRCWTARTSRRAASARATRCAPRPASRCTATTSTRRPTRTRRAWAGWSACAKPSFVGREALAQIKAAGPSAPAGRPAGRARRRAAAGLSDPARRAAGRHA